MSHKKVYLDYAATTPLADEVKAAMEPFWKDMYANPMSLSTPGQEARKEIEEIRNNIAKFFGFEQEEVVFTSGATESNNLAIKGITEGVSDWVKKYSDRALVGKDFIPHIITTGFEHHCLIDSVKYLEQKGDIEATFLKVSKEGLVDPEEVRKNIKKNTVLVSVMYVNNEVGTIQPLGKIGKIIAKEKKERKQKAGMKSKEALPIYFHSDITQGVNYLPCPMGMWQLDSFSFSAHKIYGPKGMGGLGIRKDVLIKKQQHGGGQEFDLRSGTHNVTGIVGLGAALKKVAKNWEKEGKRLKKLQEYFIKKAKKEIKGIRINGSLEHRCPNNVNISFQKVEGESILMALDMLGIACNTGSACSSSSLKASHVLTAMGLKGLDAHGSIRFTMGEDTTKKNIDYTIKSLKDSITRLRAISKGISY